VGDVLAQISVDGTPRLVHSPISGSVVLVNERLIDDPRPLSSDPFGAGWLCEMQLSYDETLEQVLDAESYGRLKG
jgi:glycine cleavage system H protein